jgi:2-dehydro-3-deoxyphosphooctonate aldolase (KDO 8-P synthase)
VLESDVLRPIFTPEAQYQESDRDHFYRQLAYIGSLLVRHGVPVIFDATHAVQRAVLVAAGSSGGDREQVPALLAAAAVAGADGFFLETHPDPARALSDAATQWPLDRLAELLDRTLDLWGRARAAVGS